MCVTDFLRFFLWKALPLLFNFCQNKTDSKYFWTFKWIFKASLSFHLSPPSSSEVTVASVSAISLSMSLLVWKWELSTLSSRHLDNIKLNFRQSKNVPERQYNYASSNILFVYKVGKFCNCIPTYNMFLLN